MGVFLILMTIGGLTVAGVLLLIAFAAKKKWLRNFVARGVAIWFVIYAGMLFGASLTSEKKLLGFNEPKEFCGFYIDCHMHTAVSGVRRAKTLGNRIANGEFYIVKVKVFSDAKRSTLGLVTVDAQVVDDQKQQFDRDLETEAQLGEQPPFDKQISPTESFEKEIIFDLPADILNPSLDIREGYGIDHVIEAILVGDEDSILHKRNYFKITD